VYSDEILVVAELELAILLVVSMAIQVITTEIQAEEC
jgi:hypothetical protein